MVYSPLKKLFHFHFRFLQNPLFKSTTTATTAITTISHSSTSFTAQYLIKSCGFSLETAISTSQKLQLQETNLQLPDSVLSLLKSHNFSNTQITKIIKKFPRLLLTNVETILRPKLHFFQQMGISDSEISEIITSNPRILHRSLENHLKPSFNSLRNFFELNENLVAAIKRSSWLLTFDLKHTLISNADLLTNRGAPNSCISKIIQTEPRAIMLRTDRFVKVVERVEKLAIGPTSPMFVHAIRGVNSMSDLSWVKKIEVFKSLGWSEEEMLNIFRREPICMTCSEDKIRKMVDFYVNTVKFEASVLSLNPKLLMYGLDNRILPRYVVILVLKSNKLVSEDMKLIRVFCISEKSFLKNYVIPYTEKVPDLMDIYCRKKTVTQLDSEGGEKSKVA